MANVSWIIPYITSQEFYTVEYGFSRDNLSYSVPIPPITSGDNTFVVDQSYTQVIDGLTFATTYHFRIVATNNVSSAASDILTFTTPEGRKNHSLG